MVHLEVGLLEIVLQLVTMKEILDKTVPLMSSQGNGLTLQGMVEVLSGDV